MSNNQFLIIMRAIIITILFFSINLNFLSAQTLYEKVDSVLNSYFANNKFNGSALVSVNGEAIYSKGFGYSNYEWDIKNETDAKFNIGSCTKQFTAALIMILNQENKLALDDNISKFIPDYPYEKGEKITIRNLLSHTSGIPEYFALPQMQDLMYKENDPLEFIKNFWDLDLEFEPGSEMKYSNSGYFVLGKIIENVTGKKYSQILDEKIFKPLLMLNSGVINPYKVLKKKAYGYLKINNTLLPAPYFNPSGAFSAGAIYSTVEDLLKWQNSLNSFTLLTKESIDLMTTPGISRYGFGFAIMNLTLENGEPRVVFGHEGGIFGYRSLIQIIKKSNSSVILLDNNQNTELGNIARDIRSFLYDIK